MEQQSLVDKPIRKKVPRAFKTSMFIDKVGIEFEGGWDRYCTHPYDASKTGEENVAAGNHRISCKCLYQKNVGDGSVECNGNWKGEVPVGPFKPTELSDQFVHYPDYGNRSCGLHVHVSFKRQYYYRRLMDPEFYVFFKEQLRLWGERTGVKNSNFYSRLRGENHYCADEWRAERQVNMTAKDGARYAILNFCYKLHKTLEVRVLPYFKSREMAEGAVRAVLNIICDWLYQHRGKRPADGKAACELVVEETQGDFIADLEIIHAAESEVFASAGA